MGSERSLIGASGVATNGRSDGRSHSSPIFIGARIKLSLLGAERTPCYSEREGTVVGSSRLTSSVRVLFDGRKTPVTLHKGYIEPIAAGSN
jgi:hypothetical protein